MSKQNTGGLATSVCLYKENKQTKKLHLSLNEVDSNFVAEQCYLRINHQGLQLALCTHRSSHPKDLQQS